MKYPANANKVYPSRKIAMLQKVIPACAVLLYQLLVAAISYCIFRYLFEWNYAMQVVNTGISYLFSESFYFTVEQFRYIAFFSLAAVALALFCLNMKRYLWNQVIFLCFAVALHLTLGLILFQHGRGIVKAGGTWNVSTDVPHEVRTEHTRRNAENGEPQAMYSLGCDYLNGWGVKKDEAEAVKWFRLAAEHGHHYAMYELGECYRKGTGVERNETEAVRWYAHAAADGVNLALSCLEDLAGEGNSDALEALESFSGQHPRQNGLD